MKCKEALQMITFSFHRFSSLFLFNYNQILFIVLSGEERKTQSLLVDKKTPGISILCNWVDLDVKLNKWSWGSKNNKQLSGPCDLRREHDIKSLMLARGMLLLRGKCLWTDVIKFTWYSLAVVNCKFCDVWVHSFGHFFLCVWVWDVCHCQLSRCSWTCFSVQHWVLAQWMSCIVGCKKKILSESVIASNSHRKKKMRL